MKNLLMLFVMVLALAGLACDVEQTTEETYEVEATADEGESSFDEAARKTETALESAGEHAEEGLREAGRKTGEAIEEAGRELKEHSEPGDQD
ncbi:MAG: hypothetical protein KY432_06830 [Acidobacteria bacterium]|nr:hypothetical protein [Acidobacteriota bacterium]